MSQWRYEAEFIARGGQIPAPIHGLKIKMSGTEISSFVKLDFIILSAQLSRTVKLIYQRIEFQPLASYNYITI